MSENLLTIGVDPSQEAYEVCLRDPADCDHRSQSFGIRRDQREAIAEEIIAEAKSLDKTRVRIYIEDGVATAEILLNHLNRREWPDFLRVQATLLAPTTVRREAQALQIDTKTDSVDAYVAAVCCMIRTIPTVKRGNYRIRKDASSYRHYIKECCRYQQKINSLLLELNPVLAEAYEGVNSGKMCAVVLKCLQTYRKEGTLSRAKLDAHCRRISYRMQNGKRRNLLEVINRETIEDRLFLVEKLQQLRRELIAKQKQVDRIKKKMEERYRDHPIVQLLTTITGIAEFTASMLVGLIGDIDKFEEADKLVGYVGTYPVKNESGKKEGKTSMSKKGVKVLKKLLYTSAMAGVREHPDIKKIHAGKVSQGMKKKAAYGVVMTKMVRWVYGIWSSREPWRKMRDEKRKSFERANARMLVKLGVELLFWSELAEQIRRELEEEDGEKEIEPDEESEEEPDT